jgi:hypothetical protein
MEDHWVVPHMVPLLERTETAIELAPDLPQKWPLRTCDLALRAIVELTGEKVTFPVKGPDQHTPDQIRTVREIALRIPE